MPYSGLVGRQETYTRGARNGGTRTLFRQNAAITLRVLDEPSNMPGDLDRFFNAQRVN